MNVQGMAEQVYLRYLQRWGKDFLRRRLDWTLDEDGGNPAAPRHLAQALCPCQYVEEVLRNKEPKDSRACCPFCNDWLRRRGLDWPNRFTFGKSSYNFLWCFGNPYVHCIVEINPFLNKNDNWPFRIRIKEHRSSVVTCQIVFSFTLFSKLAHLRVPIVGV